MSSRHQRGRRDSDETRLPTGYDFTLECRQALAEARLEAAKLGHSSVDTEHLLLALTRPSAVESRRWIATLGLELDHVRTAIERQVVPAVTNQDAVRRSAGRESCPVSTVGLPYTARAKKVLELAMHQARAWDHPYVGAEHLLVALVEEGEGLAATTLQSIGLTLEKARLAVSASATESPRQSVLESFRFTIDDASDMPIYEQIVAQVQEGIAVARLSPGARLPTVRQLADELNVAQGTVARAYAELERMQLIITEGTRGTRIAPRGTPTISSSKRPDVLVALLRPAAVAAYHLGASAPEVRFALTTVMRDIFKSGE